MAKTLTRSMTYAQLVAAIAAGTLNKGESITITDFQTTHYLCNGNGVILDPVTSEPVINTGAVERLVVHALDNNTLAPTSHSLDFPEDEIGYDWNPANWIQDTGFSADQISIIPNFKGVIFKRHDILRNNLVGYDFRTVKFRRWKKNYPAWDSGTTYTLNDKVQVPGDGCYVSLCDGNLNNAVSDNTKWARFITYNKSGEYWEHDDLSALDIEDYMDYLTFVESNTPYERAVKNNSFPIFQDTHDQMWGYIPSILSNNVFFLSDDDSYSTMNNKFEPFVELNTFGEYFEENHIGSYCYMNTFGDGCYTIYISDGCHHLEIGTSCRILSFHGLNSYIIVGEGSENMSVEASRRITLKNGSRNNKFIYIDGNGIDFSLSTHLIGDYPCTCVKTSTGTYKLKYLDGSDNTEKIVNINA